MVRLWCCATTIPKDELGRADSLALWASFAASFCSRNSFASALTAILASQEVARPGFFREPARVPGAFQPRPDT